MREQQEKSVMEHNCPHCGAPLHEGAAFCPHCAQSINLRKVVKVPVPIRRKVLRVLALLAGFAAVSLLLFLLFRPEVYDSGNTATLIYTDGGVDYQLLVGWTGDRTTPAPEIHQDVDPDGQYRFPQGLHINRVDTMQNAKSDFLPKVASITAQFEPAMDPDFPMTITPPAEDDFAPEVAAVGFIDFIGRENGAQLVWSVQMKNGDRLILRQQLFTHLNQIHDYYPEDYPMNTLAEIQSLLDQIKTDLTIKTADTVNIHLPPVTYEGGFLLVGRAMNLLGSADGNQRTTFTGGIRLSAERSNNPISYIEGIDFVGNGSGMGVSASIRCHLTDCTFSNWDIGLQATEYSWVNVQHSRFTDNQVGFHVNVTGGSVSRSIYNGNEFRRNGTAILLERTDNQVSMKLGGTVFQDNGTDIDNRCDHPLEISDSFWG
jgi:hypothetical protein